MKTKSEFLSESMIKLLHYRVEQEEFSSRLYLSMSIWMEDMGYGGAGRLYKLYSDEELIHAKKAKNMLSANGIRPITQALKQPQQEFESFSAVIMAAFDHETEITKQCYALTKAAFKEENYMVAELGLWYAKEQAEELNKVQNLVDKLKSYGEDAEAYWELDEVMEELGA